MEKQAEKQADGQAPDLAKIGEKQIKIETGKLFKVTTPAGDISSAGMCEIDTYLAMCGYGYLPEDFDAVWCTKQGTLPKRIQRHLYKAKSIKLTSENLTQLGNIAKRHTTDGSTFILDFTQKIDWQDGDFGDAGSCFWGDKAGAKDMLQQNKAYAIRAWRWRTAHAQFGLAYQNVRGYARAWVATIGNNLFAVFNGYGETTLCLARLLALKFACGYQRIHLTNKGDDGGALWINGGTAYAIGAWEKISRMEKFDLGWEEIYEEETIDCYACEARVDEDDAIRAYDRLGLVNSYCQDCASECSNCANWYSSELVRYHSATDQYLCRDCLSGEREREEQEKQREEVGNLK